MSMLSEMNANILKKEFVELKESIKENKNKVDTAWLEEFLLKPGVNDSESKSVSTALPKGNPIGQTRIGVQRGSTLMKALSDKINEPDKNFNELKKQRRDQVIVIIKSVPGGATITDIKSQATGVLASCGEKTLQRELVSMVKDSVLKKEGDKRWSKYLLVPRS